VDSTTDRLNRWAAHEAGRRSLEKVLRRFDDARIPSLPVKGILLARQLYADPLERPLADVDLLIQPRDFLRALRVARSANWPLVWDSKVLGSVNFIVDSMPVDVAVSLGPPGTSAIGVRELLERSERRVEPLGFTHSQIELHDHVLLMAVDAFKDKLRVKDWASRDLLRIAEMPGFEPLRLVRLARAARLETMLAVVASWLSEQAPSRPWTTIRDSLPGDDLRPGYARKYLAMAAAPPEEHRWRLALLARAVSDSPARRVWALALGAAGSVIFGARYGSFSHSVWDAYLERQARK
jgi:hypothetical protein